MSDDSGLQPQSMLSFLYNACGLWYTLLIPSLALAAFFLALLLVVRGRDRLVGPALVFVVSMPALVGIYASISSLLTSMMMIAYSAVMVKPSEWYGAIASSLVTAWLGLLLMTPAFLTAAIGLFVRAMKPAPPQERS